jgi:hypothetical protein
MQKPLVKPKRQKHKLPPDSQIRAKDILSSLHHEYWLEKAA